MERISEAFLLAVIALVLDSFPFKYATSIRLVDGIISATGNAKSHDHASTTDAIDSAAFTKSRRYRRATWSCLSNRPIQTMLTHPQMRLRPRIGTAMASRPSLYRDFGRL